MENIILEKRSSGFKTRSGKHQLDQPYRIPDKVDIFMEKDQLVRVDIEISGLEKDNFSIVPAVEGLNILFAIPKLSKGAFPTKYYVIHRSTIGYPEGFSIIRQFRFQRKKLSIWLSSQPKSEDLKIFQKSGFVRTATDKRFENLKAMRY